MLLDAELWLGVWGVGSWITEIEMCPLLQLFGRGMGLKHAESYIRCKK